MTKLLLLLPLLPFLHDGGDWPQYNGPGGDRRAEGALRHTRWSEEGPPEVWRIATEAGFSSFTLSEGRAYTLVSRNGRETCLALDAETGEELWASAPLAAADYDGGGGAGASDNKGGDGPRSTPSVHDGLVYVFDAQLVLTCLDAATGETRWSQDLIQDHGAKNIRWQNAASPLVEGDHVLVAGGGAGRALLAFGRQDGKLVWSRGDDAITHVTPTAATIAGTRQVLFLMQSGLVAVDPASGEELWRAEYPYAVSTAASPVVWNDLVYVSAGYGVGAGVFRVAKTAEGWAPELLWQKRNKLINHWSTPVCVDGYLYGMFSFKKYGQGPLACVRLTDGETLWSEDGFGPGNVIAVGEILVALSDAGELVLVGADPESYQELARHDLLEGKCWSSPAFQDGQLYLRSTVEGVRLDLAGQTPAR